MKLHDYYIIWLILLELKNQNDVKTSLLSIFQYVLRAAAPLYKFSNFSNFSLGSPGLIKLKNLLYKIDFFIIYLSLSFIIQYSQYSTVQYILNSHSQFIQYNYL